MFQRFAPIVIVVLLTAPLFAQRGDKGKEKQPEVWRDMDVPAAPVVPPDKAVATFKVAPGFRIELVAAEPMVEDPVAVTWDADGRLWAVEMRGYMPNVDGKGEDIRNGQIVVLEDRDGDGRMDKSTVFLGELQMPRAIAMVKGGVLIAEPPYLWYCQDTDGDLKCDTKVEALKGYARQGPVEHTENGLLPALDNWMYNAKSSRRMKFRDGKIVVENSAGRGQWGITQDNYGRLYFNSNSSYLSAHTLPADYFLRNPNHSSRSHGGGSIASDQNTHGIRPNPGVNRGYKNNFLDDKGRLRRTTATCGPGIYRGDQFPPEYSGNAFVPEPAANVVARFDIKESDGRLRAHHIAYDDPDWTKREFVSCTDERFRPVNCYTGPDGCLYIVDMYRGILQHRVYVTSFLRKQIIERGLDKPIGLGRIYRVVHDGSKPARTPRLSKAPSSQLVEHLSHTNGFWRDTAQRLLIERNDNSVVDAIGKVAVSDSNHLARIHAMWTLEGMGQLDTWTVTDALADKHPKSLATAIRMCESIFRETQLPGAQDEEEQQLQLDLLNELLTLANHQDPDVQTQLAFTLGEVRRPMVDAVLRKLLLNSNQTVRDAVISGLGGRELEFIGRLLADPAWATEDRSRDDVIHALASCVTRQRNPKRIERLLTLAAVQSPQSVWRTRSIIDGINSNIATKGRKPKPIHYDNQPKSVALLMSHFDKGVAKSAAKLPTLITWGKPPEPPKPPTPLTSSQEKLFDQGKLLFAQTCASCHQLSGLGEEGKAPPLLDSPYLLGPPSRMVRIVMQGLTGPVEVHGRVYNMDMPALQGFNDEQIAAILTYARREWEHRGDPVDPTIVAKIREETKGRELPWTVKELMTIK